MNTLFRETRRRDFDLLTIGDPNIDCVFAVQRVPVIAEKRLAGSVHKYAGGTTANVACAAGKLGLTTAVFGHVGEDADGVFLSQSFREFDVSTTYLKTVPGSASSSAMIMVEPSGEKALIYAPLVGVDPDMELLEEALARSRIVYATPYDLPSFKKMSSLAHAHGVFVAVDLEAPAIPTRADLTAWIAHADLVFLNDGAFRVATGEEPTVESVLSLVDLGPAAVIVTCGAEGALFASKAVAGEQASFAADPVDTTGAGDGFAAAFLAAALDGQDIGSAVRFACAAASFSVVAKGARSGLPDRKTVEALLVKAGVSDVATHQEEL